MLWWTPSQPPTSARSHCHPRPANWSRRHAGAGGDAWLVAQRPGPIVHDPITPHGVIDPLRPTQGCGRWASRALLVSVSSVERLGGLAADRQRPRPATLAQHPHNPLVQVDIVQGHADTFGPAHPGVHQYQDDGVIPAAGEVATLAGPEQPSQMLSPNHADRLLGQLRRSHAVHRAGLEIALGYGPLEEGVQAPVAVVGGRRLPAGELVGDEVLDVVAA